MTWTIYLSGEIHTDWRDSIKTLCQQRQLDVRFTSPVLDHDASDAAGDILGTTTKDFWRDHQSAKVNAIRTQTLIRVADIAVIRFGDKYRQWNAAFDAGICCATQTPYITLHDEALVHPLKEVDAAAHAWATTPGQVVELLHYIIDK